MNETKNTTKEYKHNWYVKNRDKVISRSKKYRKNNYVNIKNIEYLICKKCETYIRILSKRKDGTYYYYPVLPFCPNCNSVDTEKISKQKYDNFNGLWITVRKKYGKKMFLFSLKFTLLENKISPTEREFVNSLNTK